METLINTPQEASIGDIPQADALTGRATEMAFMQLQGFFGADQGDEKIITDIHKLVDGGRNLDIADILWELKTLEQRIGTPPFGMSRLQHLYNFVKIDSQINSLRKEQAAYMN